MRILFKKAIDRIIYHMPDKLSMYLEYLYPPVTFINYYKEIIKNDYSDLEYKRHKQFIKLKNLLKHVGEKFPYYRNLFKKINFCEIEIHTCKRKFGKTHYVSEED